ncbi:CLUMA_CG001946, isoform A [Clunio marinus]|uniref:CLUMA_CG001946, isoform A n=1 Tax=Clunio marinus TaxID=568069 RepID=A0A1J1HPL5_9DIPT|nr:CLUMA_CG001946, isoform A [Clunio marinus]
MKSTKDKKRNQSDQIYAKKNKIIKKKANPFELHQNRQKFNVLNRKTTHSKGQPLVSRKMAFEKRKQTIGVEYKLKNKANSFQDNRRQNFKMVKDSIYNLNDTEVLTHRGQSLAEIERFDDVLPDEEEMSDEEARLDAKFTGAAHFGGGDEADDRDRKTVIDELIAESKKRKVERTREHEEILNLTDKLDSDWKDLIPVVSKLERAENTKPAADDYDRLVREMIFSPRGEPAEKLKNEEEIARIEKERLEKLERERLTRMKGDDDDEEEARNQSKHRIDVYFDDGYFIEPVEEGNEDDDKVLSYPINPEAEQEDESNEGEHEDDCEDANDEENENSNEEESDEDESESDEGSEADSLDDLKAEEESEEEQEETVNVIKISTTEEKTKKPIENVEKQPEMNKKLSEALEKIPYTILMPESDENLCELLQSHSAKVQGIVIDRIIKTNHPRLNSMNRNKMLKLFAYLLQYLNDSFADVTEETIKKHFKVLNEFLPFLFDLIQLNPEECSKCFLEVLKEKYEEFQKNPKHFPKLDTLIFFKIVGHLFPTSDFRHPIVTPANVFIHHILSQAKVKTRSDVTSGLFLVTLFLDHQQLSKKFVPSVMNFLSGICHLGIKKSEVELIKPIPPFKRNNSLLVLENELKADYGLKLKPEDFLNQPIDDDFKVRALNLTVNLMEDFVKLYDEYVGLKYFLDPFEKVLNRLMNEDALPTEVKENIQRKIEFFQSIRLDRKFIFPQPEKKIQPMLRMLEPRFETVLSDRRSMYSQVTGAKAEQKKLKHMIKKEFKSAKRELRRDNEFVSKIRHKRRQEQDRERQAKVKRIFNEASIQQSEYNALSRTKGRKGRF